MRKMVVMVQPDQVNGYRLAGLEALGVDDADTASRLISAWLDKKEEMLLAMGDSVYSMLKDDLKDRMHESESMILVTIPDSTVPRSKSRSQQEIFDAIRHATGVDIRFKGETNGTKT